MIHRERNCDRIWEVFSVSKGRRYTYWRFTDPRTRKTVTCRSESAAKAARADARRAVREGEIKLAGLGQVNWVRFLKICDRKGVPEAVALDFLEARLPSRSEKIVMSKDAVEALLSKLRARRKSQYYIDALRIRLGKFCEKFPGPLEAACKPAIASWLDGLPLAPKTRRHYSAAVTTLFAFARGAELISAEGPAMKFERIELPEREPATFTVHALREILEACPASVLPSVVLGAFAGLRPVETLRIRWEQIDWEDGVLIAPRAKRKDARPVPLLANLRAWLEPLRSEGRIVPMSFSGLRQALGRAVRKANERRVRMGIKDAIRWEPDILRHSFGSYRWAVVRNKFQVVEEMGTSLKIFAEHYRAQKKREHGRAWFEVYPPGWVKDGSGHWQQTNVMQLDFLSRVG